MELSDTSKKLINSFAAEIVENIRLAKGVNELIRRKWNASGYSLDQLRFAGVKPDILKFIRKNWEALQLIANDL